MSYKPGYRGERKGYEWVPRFGRMQFLGGSMMTNVLKYCDVVRMSRYREYLGKWYTSCGNWHQGRIEGTICTLRQTSEHLNNVQILVGAVEGAFLMCLGGLLGQGGVCWLLKILKSVCGKVVWSWRCHWWCLPTLALWRKRQRWSTEGSWKQFCSDMLIGMFVSNSLYSKKGHGLNLMNYKFYNSDLWIAINF